MLQYDLPDLCIYFCVEVETIGFHRLDDLQATFLFHAHDVLWM